jgi:hypothetical protein
VVAVLLASGDSFAPGQKWGALLAGKVSRLVAFPITSAEEVMEIQPL